MGAKALRYYNIDKLYSDCNEVSWIWRLTALFSSWALLLGFLMIPALLDKDPQLSFDETAVVLPLTITFVTFGLLTSALASVARCNWLFQAEAVYTPALSSCFIGFIYLVSVISSSSRYEWTTAAIIPVVGIAVLVILYGSLKIYTRQKIDRISDYPYQHPIRLWGGSASPRSYAANIFSRKRSSQSDQFKDEDLTRHQMLQLLQKRDSASPDPASSTFRINLPESDDDILTLSPRGRSRANTLLPLSPPINNNSNTNSNNTRDGLGLDSRMIAEGFHPSHQRTLSREQRRREIELGN